MNLITSITNYPNQSSTFVIPDTNGDTFNLTLRYLSDQFLWELDLSYQGTLILNRPLVCSTSLLNQYKNIPFGLQITGSLDRDPYFIDDFVQDENGEANCYIYILSPLEQEEIYNLITL